MATNKPKANTLGSMFALVVSLKVKPDQRDKFLAAAEDDSICSPCDEPGCLRFDVLQDQADENHFFFYEVYRDQAAFQEHGKAPHYARWSAVRDEVLVEPPQATRTTTLFPRDYR
jgi:(4S)-4-hydroxy-5-phosphonooxypentane-2,3-dione isomerase